MANPGQPTPGSRVVAEERLRRSVNGEPLDSDERSVVQLGSSLYVNVTNFAERYFRLEKGDTVIVHCHLDRLEIVPEGDDDG